jgi:transposase
MADKLPTPSVLLADRGYDADSIRENMNKREVLPVTPLSGHRLAMPCGARDAQIPQKAHRGDRSLYRRLNLVERRFNKLSNRRRFASGCDKTAEGLLGSIDITSVSLWTRHLSE